MTKKYWVSGMLMASVVVTLTAKGWFIRASTIPFLPLICRSQIELIHDRFHLDLSAHISFIDDSGDMILAGKIVNKGKVYSINRQIFFTYDQQENNLLILNKKIDRFSEDSELASHLVGHLPDFFFHEASELALTLKYDELHTPVFFVAETPIFYCQKKWNN